MAGRRLAGGRVGGGLLACGLLGCGRGDVTVVTPPAEAVLESPARGAAGTTSTSPSPVAAAPAGSAATSPAPAGSAAAAGSLAPSTPVVPSTTPPAATGRSTTASLSGDLSRRTVPGRLIAIGDLHGDAASTRAALRLGGAIDDDGRWIGDDLTVVQTGDQLDRGDDEREILDLLQHLEAAASSQGGQVIVLNGNHEVMNVQGDFRYVTPGGIGAFAGVSPRSPLARSVGAPFEDRAAAFLPGGAYALELAKRDVVAIVGDSVFVHGGVLPDHVRYGLDRINRETQTWMRGSERQAPDAVANPSAPIWVRDYSLDPVSPQACAMLGDVLEALKVRRMVVGHTVQSQGISSACDNRVYRIDVGLSRYYGTSPIEVLEIQKGGIRTLRAARDSAP
jgi:hypothetical protein